MTQLTHSKFIAAWKKAAALKDVAALAGLLAEDAVLISPVSFKPVAGKDQIIRICSAILKVLPDLKYDREDGFPSGACLVFSGTLQDGIVVEGLDLFTIGKDGLASELKVFVRPLKAANLFAAAMAGQLQEMGLR